MSKTLLELIIKDAKYFYPDKTKFKIIANENTILKLKSQVEENSILSFEFELSNDFVDNFYRAVVIE